MVICESFPLGGVRFGSFGFSAYDVRRLGRLKDESHGVPLTLTQEALGRLLERLGTDPETAGTEYLALRARLVDWFDWRGAHRPEVAADQTLDVAARRLAEEEPIQQIWPYVYGIARNVLLEQLRRDDREQKASAGAARELVALPDPRDEERSACLVRCLAELPEDAHALIVAYYEGEGRSHLESRRHLATRLGISYNALKTRAHRLRVRVEACLRDCLADGSQSE